MTIEQRHGRSSTSTLRQEHAVLCRQLGQLQQRIGELLAERDGTIGRLDAQTLYLRGQLVVLRTALLWGLALPGQPHCTPAPPGARRIRAATALTTPSLPVAKALLCQVACSGHAHTWLDEQGQCTRDGLPCEKLSGPHRG